MECNKPARKGCLNCCNEKPHSKNCFDAVLVTFCCYKYGGNASEAVEKIAKYQEDYHKCS